MEVKRNLIMLFLYEIQGLNSTSKLIKIFINECRIKMKKQAILLMSFLWLLSFSTVHAQNNEDFFGSLNTVVIDAGHGGKDKGCLGATSYEKDVALAIALKFGAYLEETYPNLKVIFTRKTDIFIELAERAEIANRNHADLFICIHANAASSSAYGTETFVMGIAKNQANMRAAERENSSILLEDNYKERYENFDPNSPESYIALTIMQSAYQDHSVHFAELVQDQFRERVGRRDRGVKMAPFLVLHQTTMPSVLIETGFLTNLNEEKFLNSDIGQDYIASAIYRAFKEYKSDIETKSKAMVFNEVDEKDPLTEKKNGHVHSLKQNEKEGLVFKVQIATTSRKLETLPRNFKGLEGVEFYDAGGLYRYTYGNADSWEEASKLEKQVKVKGYEDAFIIAFYNKKRIGVGEAIKLLKKDK